MPHYHVDDDLNKARGDNGNLDWLVMNHLCEPINNDKDWGVTVPLLIRQNW